MKCYISKQHSIYQLTLCRFILKHLYYAILCVNYEMNLNTFGSIMFFHAPYCLRIIFFSPVFPTVLRGIQESYVKEVANIRDMVTTADTYVLAHYSFVITGTDARVQVTKFNHIDNTEYLMGFICLVVKISITLPRYS